MTDHERYERACHAMQSGVAFENGRDQEPKHLRVGINSAMVDHAALAGLLISKGLFTEAEYVKAIADGMEAEVKRYEDRLSEKHGTKVTLA